MDLETCSWCTTEVEDSTLTSTSEGRLCTFCLEESTSMPWVEVLQD